MIKEILRWVFTAACLLVVGPLLAGLTGLLRDERGGHATSLLVNNNLAMGLGILVVVLLVVAAVGVIGTRFFSLGRGIASAGFVAAWAAWGLGNPEQIVRALQSASSFPKLAVENGLVMALTIVASVAAVRVMHKSMPAIRSQGPLADLVDMSEGDRRRALLAAATGVVAGAGLAGLVASFVALTATRGQVIGAALAAGIAAGVASDLAAYAYRARAMPALPMVSMLVVAVLAPIAAMILQGDKIVEAVYSGRLVALARPLGLDWAAGALLGVPIGLSWAASMIERERPVEPIAPATSESQPA